MVSIDSILHAARQLDLSDRLRLAQMLFEEADSECRRDEVTAGERGLTSLTESTRDEDWSEFYPPDLQNGKVDRQ